MFVIRTATRAVPINSKVAAVIATHSRIHYASDVAANRRSLRPPKPFVPIALRQSKLGRLSTRTFSGNGETTMAPGVLVTVTVPDDVKEEFLQVMKEDLEGSRAEEGCLRFDLLDAGDGKYHFYEVYKDDAAAKLHKTLPHYLKWAEFKKRNMDTVGASQSVVKFDLVIE